MPGLKTVAHCATPFLPETGSWIYNQLKTLTSYRPVGLTQEAKNHDQFPLADLFTTETLRWDTRIVNTVLRKVTGQYPFYAERLHDCGAHIIHAHHGFQGVRCLRAKRKTGLPLVTSFYGADATRFARDRRWLTRFQRLFSEAELFLVEGSAMAEQLVRIGCPHGKVQIHHLGVDLERIPLQQVPEAKETRILLCASFREKKGIPDGIEAVARVVAATGADLRLVLMGDGPDRPAVEAALSSHPGLPVDLVGYAPYDQLLKELTRCHILLQPSKLAVDGDSEGGAPVVLLDAQAAGVPVVSTRHADIPEYVLDGKGGLLAPERDIDGLAERLAMLVNDPKLRWRMGQVGRAHVNVNYNSRRQVVALQSIYDTFT